MPAPRAQQQLPGQSHSCPLLTQAETLGVTLGCPLATCLIYKEIELALSNTYPDSRLPLFAATAPTAWPRSRQPGPLPDPALPAPPTSPQSCVVDSGIVPSQSPPPPRTARLTAPSPAHPAPFPAFLRYSPLGHNVPVIHLPCKGVHCFAHCCVLAIGTVPARQ